MQLAFFFVACFVALGTAHAQSVPQFPKAYKDMKQSAPPSNRWLSDADDDAERWRRLETAMSGTDIPMMEIAYRFEELVLAVKKQNFAMGEYHLNKLRDRMNVAGMKRPARTANLEAMWLNSGVYAGLSEALKARDLVRAQERLTTARVACMACHVAEGVGHLNDSSVFDRTLVETAKR